MNSAIRIPSDVAPSRRRRHLSAMAVAVVTMVGLTACNSDPSARRVAEDIINTSIQDGDITQSQGDCMLEKLGALSDSELDDITASADSSGPGTALDVYEADLATCRD